MFIKLSDIFKMQITGDYGMDTNTIIAIVIPLALIDTGMKIFSAVNLVQTFDIRSQTNKIAWLIAILAVNLFGWLMYLLFGRIPQEKKSDEETWD